MKIFVVLFCFVAVCSALKIHTPKYAPEALQQPHILLIQQLIKEVHMQEERGEKISININKYMDAILKLVRFWMVKLGLDPLQTEDLEEGFSVKIWPITWHGEFKLQNGYMNGLSSISRGGDCKINYEAQLLNFRVYLEFDSIDINYDWLVKFMNIGPTGGVQGKIKDLKLYVDITIDTKSIEIYLQGFEIVDAGRIKLKFSGNPLIDWISNIITSIATRLLHGVATNVIEKTVRGVLEGVIEDINNQLRPKTIY